MPSVTIAEASLAANTKSAEQLSGTQIAYAPKNGVLRVYGRSSAIGLKLTLTVGAETVIDDQDNAVIKAAGASIARDTDMIYAVGVRKGEQLRFTLRNSTAGAITSAFLFELL